MKSKMKTTLLLLLFPLLLFFVDHADAQGETGKDSDLKCSKKTIAELGKNVTLDCYCKPPCYVTGEELRWKFNQKTNVLAYRGDYKLNQQDAQFIGRAQVSSTESLKDGNFSVTISKLNKSDEGTYTCHVESKTFNVGNKTCSVELQFKVMTEDKQTPGARDDDTTTTSNAPDAGTISGIVVGAVLLVFAVFAAGLFYRNRKSLPSCKGTQRGGEQDGEEMKELNQ